MDQGRSAANMLSLHSYHSVHAAEGSYADNVLYVIVLYCILLFVLLYGLFTFFYMVHSRYTYVQYMVYGVQWLWV